jgi:hypothetical protein
MLGRYSSAIRAACANERSCGSVRGAISNGRPYRDQQQSVSDRMRDGMIAGQTSLFAIESEITRAFEKPSWRGLGFFVIHIMGRCYGIKSPGNTMLACSFDEVGRRISGRGRHTAPFAEAAAADIANAYTTAIYLDHGDNDIKYFGMSEARFTEVVNSSGLVWAPDGDEAFDDGSYVLQFDVGDRVRLIAFNRPDWLVDAATLREAWLAADSFYDILRQWRGRFMAEWESLPKHS